MKEQKKVNLQLKLNEIKKSEDPTVVNCTYIILDFEVSRNNAIVEKEVGLELGETIINKPLVARYLSVQQPNTNTDNFTSHEAKLSTDKYGNDTIKLDTVPIGVFTTKGYIMTINDENGNEKEVLAADAVLWKSRFSDAVDLLIEWYNRGININTSCEFLYKNYTMKDGIEYVQSPVWFEGHCHLASENRGGQDVVLPAYESSTLLSFNEINQFNRLVAEAVDLNESEEGERMEKLRKIFELSHSDVRSLLYSQLDSKLPEGTYSYISDVYDAYFIVNLFSEEYDKHYKYEYTKGENDALTVNFESKSEVALKRDWIEVTQVQQMQNELDEAKQKLNELEVAKNELEETKTQLNSTSQELEGLKLEKSEVETKFNKATDKLTQLNSRLDELVEVEKQFNQEKYEKALNEKVEYYSAKFSAVNGAEKFNTEEVQELIKQSLSAENGKDAILQLNTMLVDMVVVTKQEDNTIIREMASKREDLIPASTDFDSKYL